MNDFKSEWKEFHEKVVPKTAGPVQIEETRKAFYSGALAVISLLSKMFTSDREVTEQDMDDYEVLVSEVVNACRSFTLTRDHEMN